MALYILAEATDSMSREFTVFPVAPIELGSPCTTTPATGQQFFFKVDVPARKTVRFKLAHASRTAWTKLYAGFAAPPDVARADFVSATSTQPTAEVIVPATQAGTYYIAKGPAAATKENYFIAIVTF